MEKQVKLSEAVAKRINELLKAKSITQYRLEKNIAMPHNTMKTLMGAKNNGVNLKTIMQIIRGLNITTAEFFNSPIFECDDLDID